jgi:hypothetical protein
MLSLRGPTVSTNGEYDDDLDGLLGKPFVGTVLGVLAEVIEDWAEKQ